jgi:hypothetical protein
MKTPTRYGATAAAIALACHTPASLTIAVTALSGLALLIYVGIALPAVWSRNLQRRDAAANVLCQVLTTLKRNDNLPDGDAGRAPGLSGSGTRGSDSAD